MKRTNGSLARHARPLFVTATLVSSIALAFTPSVPSAIALNASPEPSPAVAPTTSPAPDPTPDPTADPTPAPTADVAPTPAPEVPVSSPTPAPGPVATPAPPQAPTRPASGPRAISFDATKGQYARVADDPAFHLPVFTVETWLRRVAPRSGEPAGMSGLPTTTATPPDAAAATPASSSATQPGDLELASVIPLVTRGDGQDAAGRLGWFLGFDARSAVLVADFQDDANGSHHPVVGTTRLADATWYHAAATYDGSTWRLYLNGRLEAQRRLGDVTPDISGTAPVGLGTAISGDNTTTRGAFDGDIDETRIWAVARTGAEIRANLNKPVAADAKGLVAAWSMDEADGDRLSDVTAADHDASLAGDPVRIDSPVPDDTMPVRPGSLTAHGVAAQVALDWTAVRARDLAGYNVYRTETGRNAADAEPLNGPVPITDTAYRDIRVVAGTSYRFVVTAVDRFGNESGASEAAAASIDAAPARGADPSPTAKPAPAADASPIAEPAPTVEPSPRSAPVVMTLASDAPSEGRHRVDPGSTLTMTIALTAPADDSRSDLVLSIADGWTVLDADGGIVDTARHGIGWLLAGVPAGSEVAHHVRFLAPSVFPPEGASLASTFASWLEAPGVTTAGPTLDVLVAPSLVVGYPVLARVDTATLQATYLPAGAPITGEQRFETFRLRYQVRNGDDLAVAVTPRLEFRAAGAAEFRPVPALEDQAGVPFFVGREWTQIPGGGGTELGPVRADIPAGSMLVTARDGPDQVAVTGIHSMGLNPLTTVELPGRSFTEIEFSVRATAAAEFLAGYEFRITDGGQPISNAPLAEVSLGARPAIQPATVLRNGVPAGGTEPDASAATGKVTYALQPSVAAASAAGAAPRYTLVVAPASSTTGASAASGQTAPDSPHGGYSATTDACASCHSTHSAAGPALLVRASPESTLCLSCHRAGGNAADTDVEAQYADPTVPRNDPATRTYYSHDALAPNSGHTSAVDDEFGGKSSRHSECADCHSPHAATSTASVQTSAGWTASGRLGQVSGVSVANSSTAGGTPAYTLIGGASAPVTLEYQLCFKCHSGYTNLPSNAGFTPSRYLLDKAVELNPKNPSFHPIEAPGTNGTPAMTASLTGPSTYKLWNFSTTSTIRCENCHGDDRTAARALADQTALDPGADLAPHANQPEKDPVAAPIPGILIGSYKFRELKGPSDGYAPADFALCYTCHSEEPFLDTTGSPRADTNFPGHGQHVSGIANRGPGGTDIDKAGEGGGLATCAECHFRIHSTTYRVGGQDAYPRLVNFAPNVTADGSTTDPVGTNAWDPTAKTCTLTCHGQPHGAKGY